MVSVNIPQEIWIPFLKDSVDKRISASSRICDFIRDEINYKKEGEEE